MNGDKALRYRSLELDERWLRRLEGLALRTRRAGTEESPARRTGAVRTGRMDFRGHRAYVPGDDLRDLDWNVYARSGEPFVKVFGADRVRHVRLFVDLSASVRLLPAKERFLCRLAAALAHVALLAGDRVWLAALEPGATGVTLEGPATSRRAIAFLEQTPGHAAVEWRDLGRRLLPRLHPGGRTFLLSDFWDGDAVAALQPWVAAGEELALAQILAPEELAPPLDGAVQVEDAESERALRLDLTPERLAAYRAAVEAHVEHLARAAHGHGVAHRLHLSDASLESAVLAWIRAGRPLR